MCVVCIGIMCAGISAYVCLCEYMYACMHACMHACVPVAMAKSASASSSASAFVWLPVCTRGCVLMRLDSRGFV